MSKQKKSSDQRIVKKNYKSLPQSEIIRLGNEFVNDFMFEDNKAVNIPIDALRTIFNIASNLRNEQHQPKDRPHQLSLFEEEFETENNTFASMKIKNRLISPSGTSKQVQSALEFLTKFKMDWYATKNKEGKEIKTFGGLITSPSYDERGYTSFLISSYWLKKLIVIPEYNPTLFNLVYNISNNKHIIFAIWLAKIPDTGTSLKLSTFNEKFGVNYSTAKDFGSKFLKPIQQNLHKHNTVSFSYTVHGDKIHIKPYLVSSVGEWNPEKASPTKNTDKGRERLRYYRRTHQLDDQQSANLSHYYTSMPQNEVLIESAYKSFVRYTRKNKTKCSSITGIDFLQKLQEFIILIYRDTPTGKVMPNGFPKII